MTRTNRQPTPPNSQNLSYIEEVWQRYLSQPDSVPRDWRDYFEKLKQSEFHINGTTPRISVGHEQLYQEFGPGGKACAGCGRAAARGSN